MPIQINGTGTITGLSAGGLPDGSVTAADLASGAITAGALPAGSILQVQSSVKLGSQVVSSSSQVDITDLSVSITPASNDSKIVVLYNVAVGGPVNNAWALHLVRGSTNLFEGNGEAASYPANQATTFGSFGQNNNFIQSVAGAYVDEGHASGGTSVTYKIQGRILATNNAFRVGRSWDVDNNSYRSMSSSSIVVMEVAG